MACAACGHRGLFRKFGMFSMLANCPRCDLRFERMEGHSLGAVAVNTVASAAVVLMAVVFALLVFGIDTPTKFLLLLAAPVGLLFPIAFDPISRTLWNAMELLMRPLEPHEIKTPPNGL